MHSKEEVYSFYNLLNEKYIRGLVHEEKILNEQILIP